MTNDRKPLPEDDFVGNAAPFVLKITLEYPPRETESLLGFMPKEGKNFYDFEKFPDKRFYGNIERAFGTLMMRLNIKPMKLRNWLGLFQRRMSATTHLVLAN